MAIVLQLHYVKMQGSLTLEGISLKNVIEVKRSKILARWSSFLSKPEAISDKMEGNKRVSNTQFLSSPRRVCG